jgi:hypothetical protein
MFNKEILEVILLPNDHEKEMREEEAESLLTITYNEAVETYDKVILYLK